MTDRRYSIGDLDGLLGIVVAAVVADIHRANEKGAVSGKTNPRPLEGERDQQYPDPEFAQPLPRLR